MVRAGYDQNHLISPGTCQEKFKLAQKINWGRLLHNSAVFLIALYCGPIQPASDPLWSNHLSRCCDLKHLYDSTHKMLCESHVILQSKNLNNFYEEIIHPEHDGFIASLLAVATIPTKAKELPRNLQKQLMETHRMTQTGEKENLQR